MVDEPNAPLVWVNSDTKGRVLDGDNRTQECGLSWALSFIALVRDALSGSPIRKPGSSKPDSQNFWPRKNFLDGPSRRDPNMIRVTLTEHANEVLPKIAPPSVRR
jgi:hypothetical protein